MLYNIVSYGVSPETIDYDEVERIARKCAPSSSWAARARIRASSTFARMAAIAHEVGAYLMVDMAHIAGLVATGAHPSPAPYADITTSTSHKTLRGPRGGFILTNDEALSKKVQQGNLPLGLREARSCTLSRARRSLSARRLSPTSPTTSPTWSSMRVRWGGASPTAGFGWSPGGTDNHLCLVDLTAADVTGKDAEKILESVGLTVNKNTIPNETRSPFVTSGIRVGSAAATTRDLDEMDFYEVGRLIAHTVLSRWR